MSPFEKMRDTEYQTSEEKWPLFTENTQNNQNVLISPSRQSCGRLEGDQQLPWDAKTEQNRER